MFKYGVIHEVYDDEHEFPVDRDINDIVYILNSLTDYLCRSKVVYHDVVLKKKREEVNAVYEQSKLEQVKLQEKVKAIITDNREREKTVGKTQLTHQYYYRCNNF